MNHFLKVILMPVSLCFALQQTVNAAAVTDMATDASINELITLMQVDETNDEFHNQLQEILDSIESETIKDKQLSTEQKTQLQQIKADHISLLNDAYQDSNIADLLQQNYFDVYKKHYTQQEVNALINFYQTDIGQSILSKDQIIKSEIEEFIKSEPGVRDGISQILGKYFTNYYFEISGLVNESDQDNAQDETQPTE